MPSFTADQLLSPHRLEEHKVQLFQEYLRIDSTQPTPNLALVKDFLQVYAEALGAIVNVFEGKEGYPVFYFSIPGLQPETPSILLNSHADVVPFDRSKWNWDPLGAEKDANGNIYARGTQDMKCVTIQHLEALLNLKKKGIRLRRTIHVSVMPDEEVGGEKGMVLFLDSPEFQSLNVGLAFDEGLANEKDEFTVFYGERAAWWIDVISQGPTGHGSRFVPDPAVHRLLRTIEKFLAFRKEQNDIYDSFSHECGKTLGDVVTLNLTMLKTNSSNYNVVPNEAVASFDIRIPPHINLTEFRSMLNSWLEDGMTMRFQQYTDRNASTSIQQENAYWKCFSSSLDRMSLKYRTEVFPAATDSRFIRKHGIDAFGFSPIKNTPILLHDHNEFLNEKIFLDGIPIFEQVISDLGDLE